MHPGKNNMKSTLYKRVFQGAYLLLFLGCISATWFLKDASDRTLSTAAAIIFSLLLLQSMQMSSRV